MAELEVASADLNECPYCGGTIISAEEADFDCGGRKVNCESCGRYWTEGFMVTTVFIPEQYKSVYLERRFIEKSCTCGKKKDEFCSVHDEELNH